MKKKILIISGSPRKAGNTDLICDRFMDGAASSGHQVEKIIISDKKIEYCIGCCECFESRACPHDDDMKTLIEKLKLNDVYVFATPVYFNDMTAQLKTFIDRCAPIYQKLASKEIYFIVTAADEGTYGLERTLTGLRGFTLSLPGSQEKGIIYGGGVWDAGAIKGSVVLQEAFEIGCLC